MWRYALRDEDNDVVEDYTISEDDTSLLLVCDMDTRRLATYHSLEGSY